ncbi:MAG TPA: SIS domain-containing protein [Anaerolineaceae bacterium]
MNLDDLAQYKELDLAHLGDELDAFPSRFFNAFIEGCKCPLFDPSFIRVIVFLGSGEDALAGELLASLINLEIKVPVVVITEDILPAWVSGDQVLVMALFDGDSNETLLAGFSQAAERNCSRIAVCMGEDWFQDEIEDGLTYWNLRSQGEHKTRTVEWIGYLLGAFSHIGFLDLSITAAKNIFQRLKAQAESIQRSVPISENPAKRMSGQLVGRQVAVFGAGYMLPVAKSWCFRLNRMAKTWAQAQPVPYSCFSSLDGIYFPESTLSHLMALFIKSANDHSANHNLIDLTRKLMMMEGINTDFYLSSGTSPLECILTALQFGDYLAYYLAIANGIDPASGGAVDELIHNLGRLKKS